MTTATSRRAHERWLMELTALPTAAGREDRVIDWVEAWVARRRSLRIRRDGGGNLVITRAARGRGRPVFVTAHLDHPAFVVRRILDDRTVELEFRGGVHDAYFENATIEIFDGESRRHRATILELHPRAKPFKRVVAGLTRSGDRLRRGDVGRWALRGKLPRISRGLLHTHACDDLAGVAAALGMLDTLVARRSKARVGVLLTRAEEVGFIGTLAACVSRTVPKQARLICVENSRSFPESPIGGGPVLRVGDKMSVFAPSLTNRLADVLARHETRASGFKWQRKLMPGGTCEATAFAVHGYESTCVCLPLGNYHNMVDIDGVYTGAAEARVGPEFISIDDFHWLVELLTVSATRLDSVGVPPLHRRLDRLLRTHGFVLEEGTKAFSSPRSGVR